MCTAVSSIKNITLGGRRWLINQSEVEPLTNSLRLGFLPWTEIGNLQIYLV